MGIIVPQADPLEGKTIRLPKSHWARLKRIQQVTGQPEAEVFRFLMGKALDIEEGKLDLDEKKGGKR